jgi:hypothetical protein
VESESEGILGGVGVGRNFGWSRSRSRKEFCVESESEGILGGAGVGTNFGWSRSRKEFGWSRSRKEFLGGVGVGKICTDSESDLSLKS